MQTLHRIADLRQQVRHWRRAGLRIGFVPTMGNLHAGHISLVTEARRHADKIVASVFVNPTQFGPSEDFDAYPRTLAADQAQLAAAGCDLLFAPSVDEMYPDHNRTWVDVDTLGDTLCGRSRPGHFRGVTTVVSKLFHIVEPDIACFGEKDFQQLTIIRRMVRDLFLPITVIGVPTAREPDGLAMSSRNSLLTAAEKQQASAMYATLCATRDAILAGQRDYPALVEQARTRLQRAGLRIDYFDINAADTLAAANRQDRQLVIAAAVKMGQTRLIDNVTLSIECDQ